MREIIFRGKRADNGEWVEGAYYHQTQFYGDSFESHYIITTTDELEDNMMDVRLVIPETIGQYTGLTANGKKIFEGDIVKGKDNLEKDFEFCGYVDHFNGSFVIVGDIMTHYRWLDYDVEIIGNIHDNPELLGKEGVDNDRN